MIRTRRKEFSFKKGDLSTIYNSRTFCLYKDIDQIRSQGLAKGGSLDNAIVVKENEILNENGLRNRHEFVSHKILDCLGDLLLSGYRIHGHLKTSQGGHLLTNQLLRELFSNETNWKFETSATVTTHMITETEKNFIRNNVINRVLKTSETLEYENPEKLINAVTTAPNASGDNYSTLPKPCLLYTSPSPRDS